MTPYNYDRPFIAHGNMQTYVASDGETASEFGRTVKATGLSNVEYKIRFGKLKRENNMNLLQAAEPSWATS